MPSPDLGAVVRRALARLARQPDRPAAGAQQLVLDYPVDPTPRWGYDKPPHPVLLDALEAARPRIRTCLESFLPFVDELSEIPFDAEGTEPRWVNGYFQGLDATSLYGFLVQRRPATYLEIGSGHSTRFARRAIQRHTLPTLVTAIDPSPRASLEGLVDRHIEQPLEACDAALFEQLDANDVLVLDGSHRAFTNSDVTVFFCEILPSLPAGLLVYVDDVFLPWDYPPQLADQWWSEQYLLLCWLLAGDRLEITLPSFWVSTEPELHRILAPLWDRFTWAAVPTNGTGFWVTVR